MTITKYEHACLVVEAGGSRLIIDPGEFLESLQDFTNFSAVVITHAHGDHFDQAKLQTIASANPKVRIFTVPEVAEQLADMSVTTVAAGDTQQIDGFTLQFYGGQHAAIHSSMPPAQNVGIMVNDRLYYPGDSLVIPGVPVPILALPSDAPWLKIGEAIDFLNAIKPVQAFATHDALLSGAGAQIHNRILGGAAQKIGTNYHPLTLQEVVET